MLDPPDTRSTTGRFSFAETQFRNTPLVSISASAYESRGSMVSPGFSSLLMGPKKYPWSMANITVRPSAGLMMRLSLFSKPQSIARSVWHAD